MAKGYRTLASLKPPRHLRALRMTKADKRKRSITIVKAYLFAQDAYFLHTNNDGPLLLTAAREGRVELVRVLLKMGQDPNLRGALGCTALHEAAAKGNLEVMRTLVTSGADVMARTETGQTALHWAADVGDFDAVLLLLAADAQFDAASELGFTPLDFAAANGHNRVADLLEFYRQHGRK